MGLSHLPISETGPIRSVPYRKPNYSEEVIAQLKSEITRLELSYKMLRSPKDFGIADQSTIEAEFYGSLARIEKNLGVKACPDGESNLWKELHFLLANDQAQANEYWMAFHQISEFREPGRIPEAKSTEEQIAEIEAKLEALLKTWHDYTGTEYPL
jgi:hypothetical protein